MSGSGSRPLVAVTRSSLPGGGLDRLREHADVVLWADDDDVPAAGVALRDLARGADAVLAPYAKVDREFLESVQGSVRIVALPSAGYDAVDVGAALESGVMITNAPDVLHETTADTTFALMLLARRLLFPAARDLHEGRWNAPGSTSTWASTSREPRLGWRVMGRLRRPWPGGQRVSG
ncbi:MAG: hypothetical protein ACLGHS_03080 [Actinomycetes bacterium]